MIEKIDKQESKILDSISSLKNNRNPFLIFFVLADLKDIFINLWETLLNSIELNYSKNARNTYKIITQKYKDAWIFESLYNHYLHSNDLKKFRDEIDLYFEKSFFIDISFFLYTISRNEKYKILFNLILTFYKDENLKNKYYELSTYLKKKKYLSKINNDFLLINKDKDSFFIIKFLNQLSRFNFWDIFISGWNFIWEDIKLFKSIILKIFEEKDKNIDLYEFILETFVYDKNIYDEVIEKFEDEKLFDVILFLKNDIHSGIDYSFSLDYYTKINIKKYLEISFKIEFLSIEEKIDYLILKENDFLNLWWEYWNFARLSFKRQYLENNYDNIIDLILWITDIPTEVFYLLKQQNLNISLEDLKLYNEIKELIIFIEKSYFLSFLRPFLLRNISRYFNNSDQKYYIVKFILCVILSNSYSEYKRVSKFFYNLEVFYKTSLEAFLSRIFQFWWIIIFTLIVWFFLPFWVYIAIFIFLIKEIITHIFSKIYPRLNMSLNFHLSTFLVIFAFFSIFLWSTIWYKDNMNLSYNFIKSWVNAITLPTHESLKILFSNIEKLKANVIWTNQIKDLNKINYSDIDYFDGKNLIDLRK